QLPASRKNIATHGSSQKHMRAGINQSRVKFLNRCIIRTLKTRTRMLIKWNDIDLAWNTASEFMQFFGMLHLISHAFEKHILESDLVTRFHRILATLGKQIFEWIFFIDRHDFGAHFIIVTVEAHSQTHIGFSNAPHFWNQTRSRNRNFTTREVYSPRIMQNLDRFKNGFWIIQRLAHSHKHDIADALAFLQTITHLHVLTNDLRRSQTTFQLLFSGKTKLASHVTTDLT